MDDHENPRSFIDAVVRVLARPMIDLAHEIESFDPRTPATFFDRMVRSFEKAGAEAVRESVDRRAVLGALDPAFIAEFNDSLEAAARAQKTAAARDPRYSLLLHLIAEADAAVPHSALLPLLHFDLAVHLRRMCEPVDLFHAAHTESGEIRARAIVRALRETAELLYEPYLRQMWFLSCLARRTLPGQPPKFGALVEQCAARLADYPGLVDRDFAWLRNAAAHAQWQYAPRQDALVLWDGQHAPTTVAVKELLERARAAYLLSGPTLQNVILLHVTREFRSSGFLEALATYAPDLGSPEDAVRASAEAAVEEFGAALFAGVRDLAPEAPVGASTGR